MSVSMEQSSFNLPDFTSPEFHAVDLPLATEKRRATDHVYSSASFTSWRNANGSLRDQPTNSTSDSVDSCCEDEEHSLEACDSAFWQGRVKSAQIASIKERDNQSGEEEEEGLTFPTKEMTTGSPLISTSPLTEQVKLSLEHNPSRKSLYRPSTGMGTSKAVIDGWIRVEFWILDDLEIEIELAFIEEASRQFYIMEKEREEQFYSRNEEVFQRVSLTAERNNQESSTDSEDEFEGIPKCNEYNNNLIERKASSTRSTLTQLRDKRILRLTKSVSMTTLIRREATESVLSTEEDPPMLKTLQRVLPTDFGFSSVVCGGGGGDISSAWSTSTPKLRRNLNKQIKRKWQPVSRFVVRRCHAWDGGSSSGDGYSSKGCSFSLRRILHRIVCCGRALSSDDDDDETSR